MRTAILVLALLAVVACSKDRPDGAGGTTTTTGASTDAAVTVDVVRDALLEHRPNDREAINAVIITTEGGAVILRGRVDDEAMRQDLVSTVKSVPGVTRVDDQLQVVPQRAGQQPGDPGE